VSLGHFCQALAENLTSKLVIAVIYEQASDLQNILARSEHLKQNASTLSAMRNRFRSAFKREKMDQTKPVNTGNDKAHGGNALYDATLYDHGRIDFNIYKKLYGLHPYIVSTGKPTKLCIQSCS
jgi:hypothetical protein